MYASKNSYAQDSFRKVEAAIFATKFVGFFFLTRSSKIKFPNYEHSIYHFFRLTHH